MMEQSKIHIWFKLSRLSAAIIFTCLIFILSHIPQKNLPDQLQIFGLDKIIHIIAYGIITYLAISSIKFRPYLRIKLIIFVFVSLLGYFDEYTQSFVGRTCSMVDWLADVAGVVLGLIYFEIKNRFIISLSEMNPD